MSGKNKLITILIVSLHVCLLHGRSLRIAERSSAEDIDDQKSATIHSEEDIAVDSSCSPSRNQLEYYNELYSINAPNNGNNGSTLYYALRAIEAHKNRTESVTTADDDIATISSISDPSRFAPAGMETANKVICAKILQEMDEVANVISNTAACPWIYYCDYKADRFPNYLFKARCRTARCSSVCSQENNIHNTCQAHGIHVTVLQMRGNCKEWVFDQELLPIACTCTTDVVMKG